MKLVCIGKIMPGRLDVEYQYLTIGKVYDCLNVINELSKDDPMVKIEDDSGDFCYYYKGCFKSLDDCREEKIKDILNYVENR